MSDKKLTELAGAETELANARANVVRLLDAAKKRLLPSGATGGKWEVSQLSKPMDNFTGSQFIIRSPEAPGGVAVVMGGLGKAEEEANALLMARAPRMAAELFRALAVISNPQAFDIEGVTNDIISVLSRLTPPKEGA